MNDSNREREQLDALLNKPGGEKALRFALNVFSGVPLIGSLGSALGSEWAAREQAEINQLLFDWADQTDVDLVALMRRVDELTQGPSPTSMALLIAEVIGRTPDEGEQVRIMLNSLTVNELQPYVAEGWVVVQPAGGMMNLGAGNRIGDFIEDQKNPHGMGNGYMICVPTWDISV